MNIFNSIKSEKYNIMKSSFISYNYFVLLIFSLLILTESSYIKNLRKLWNEKVDYDDSKRIGEEDSIAHCRNSNYKYFIHYVTGENYTFNKISLINQDNAVRINFGI